MLSFELRQILNHQIAQACATKGAGADAAGVACFCAAFTWPAIRVTMSEGERSQSAKSADEASAANLSVRAFATLAPHLHSSQPTSSSSANHTCAGISPFSDNQSAPRTDCFICATKKHAGCDVSE